MELLQKNWFSFCFTKITDAKFPSGENIRKKGFNY